uniref:Adenine DNA glycosylase n=1 Tax=uncultured Chloroflexota bacterium TaxID=166587 RepID=H5SF24_9CHLR|nr:A/G-specific adenine glycosylase [uncultured Chloroflexota bacterium]
MQEAGAASSGNLGEALLEWYRHHQRKLPWRGLSDAYAIWVAEVMLQQTRVETVIPYFERWMKRFPNVAVLAEASEEEVLRLWEGLGYYQRARNLHRAAQRLVKEYGGALPAQVEVLRTLPGIGAYTAAAIASFAFGQDEIALDGNLKRVLARLSDLEAPLEARTAQKELEAFARRHLPKGHSAEFNQALMDLGAEICLPERPLCETCPFQCFCLAYQRGTVLLRPVPATRRAVPWRIQISAVMLQGGNVLLRRRPSQGLLGGLWTFPSAFLEAEEAASTASLFEAEGLLLELEKKLGDLRHAYTHFRLRVEIWHCRLLAEPGPSFSWVALEQLTAYPMGKIDRQIARLLQQL